jgi:hypothetical protein
MSGIVQNNILRSSGTIAVSAAGLNWVDTIITGSTATVEAGNGYWVNTTSNTCTITLPSSAEKGDQIVIIDYARTWGTNKIIIDSNGLNYQGNDDTYTVEYTTDGQSVNIVYSDATKGWIPLEDDVVADAPVAPATQRAIFAYGRASGKFNLSNLVGSNGVVGNDVTGVGTARNEVGATTFGGDKGIFKGGDDGSAYVAMTNIVSNQGVVATDVTAVGARAISTQGAGYGVGLGIFGFGFTDAGGSQVLNKSQLVNFAGVVGTDVTGVGTARNYLAAASYGGDKAAFAFGTPSESSYSNLKNLVSNQGVVASDSTGVGTGRSELMSANYGGDKGVFAYGTNGSGRTSVKNLMSNTGVIASDVSGVGTVRSSGNGAQYGGDKGIIAYGSTGSDVSISNLINNVGVIATDTSGVGTARRGLGAVAYGYSA